MIIRKSALGWFGAYLESNTSPSWNDIELKISCHLSMFEELRALARVSQKCEERYITTPGGYELVHFLYGQIGHRALASLTYERFLSEEVGWGRLRCWKYRRTGQTDHQRPVTKKEKVRGHKPRGRIWNNYGHPTKKEGKWKGNPCRKMEGQEWKSVLD